MTRDMLHVVNVRSFHCLLLPLYGEVFAGKSMFYDFTAPIRSV